MGDKVAQEVIAMVRSNLNQLYDSNSFVPSPNAQVPIGSKGTQVNPYTMVEKYMAENCEGRKVVNFDILE